PARIQLGAGTYWIAANAVDTPTPASKLPNLRGSPRGHYGATFPKVARPSPFTPPLSRYQPAPPASLARLAPELAAQWHPTKNRALRPEHVTLKSVRRVWWRCARGRDHQWRSTVRSRTRTYSGRGFGNCPFCSNKLVSVTNSVAARAPWLVSEWHPTK